MLTYSLSGEPVGAIIGPAGDFAWTPSESQGGQSFTFSVIVADDWSPIPVTNSEQITVAVTEQNEAPQLSSIGAQSVTENSSLWFLASATDTDIPANTLTFSLSASAPSAASISAGGMFTWSPTEADGPGICTFDVIVTDDGSPVMEDRETITVTVSEDNLAPTLR